MTAFYTYFHCRKDDGKVFYVGKGHGRRAWHNRRNKWWRSVVEKHGYQVHIACHWADEKDAFEHERFLIACFRDLGAPLVNLTDGGEGFRGGRHTQEHKAYLSRIFAGRPGKSPSKETREKISERLKGKTFRSGFCLSPDHIAKRSATRRSAATKFMDCSGIQMSAAEWAKHLGLHISTIQYRIKTNKLIRVEKE